MSNNFLNDPEKMDKMSEWIVFAAAIGGVAVLAGLVWLFAWAFFMAFGNGS